MRAKRVDAITLLSVHKLGSTVCLVTNCADFDVFQALPDAVEYEGSLFGKTGWNSDLCKAYYRNDARLALAR